MQFWKKELIPFVLINQIKLPVLSTLTSNFYVVIKSKKNSDYDHLVQGDYDI